MTRLFRSLSLAACAAALTAGPAIAHDGEGDDTKTEITKGEKKLAKLLEGRVAGEPVSCIRNYPSQNLQVIDKTAYVYGRGRTIYVQRTMHPEHIDDDDVLVLKTSNGSRICRPENITTVDRSTGMFNGVVFLDDFIPYTTVESDKKG